MGRRASHESTKDTKRTGGAIHRLRRQRRTSGTRSLGLFGPRFVPAALEHSCTRALEHSRANCHLQTANSRRSRAWCLGLGHLLQTADPSLQTRASSARGSRPESSLESSTRRMNWSQNATGWLRSSIRQARHTPSRSTDYGARQRAAGRASGISYCPRNSHSRRRGTSYSTTSTPTSRRFR